MEAVSVSKEISFKDGAATKTELEVIEYKDGNARHADVDMNNDTHSDVCQTTSVDGKGADIDVASTANSIDNKGTLSIDAHIRSILRF